MGATTSLDDKRGETGGRRVKSTSERGNPSWRRPAAMAAHPRCVSESRIEPHRLRSAPPRPILSVPKSNFHDGSLMETDLGCAG